MAKEKWYITTGRESHDTMRNAISVMFSNGVIYENGDWSWSRETTRTGQRLFDMPKLNHTIIAYTLGEKV